MNPVHHPTEAHWLDYVSGQMDGASRILLEAHLAFCAPCRRAAAQDAVPGGAQLAPAAPEPPPALLQAILGRLDSPTQPRVGTEQLPLPEALWSLFPDLQRAHWGSALTWGFRFLEVPLPGAETLYLIHMQQGRPFPRHSHRGLERSVILRGGLRDEDSLLEPGDFAEADSSCTHTPVALPDEDCWLLASLEGGIRFTGWRGVLQRLAPEA